MRFARTSLALALGLVATLTTAVLTTQQAAAASPIPNSMASMGDSITRGFNASGWFVDSTGRSFSTGTDSVVNSQYSRILAKNPTISGKNFNDGKTGAKATDMAGQASTAVGQHVDYVTILIGANDACTSSESTMTAVTTFRSQIDSALNTLKTGLPTARVELISIPDIFRLWTVGHVS